MNQGDADAMVGQIERFLDRGIAAADDHDLAAAEENPSQVAQAETPEPRNLSSLGKPSQRACAPVQIASASAI